MIIDAYTITNINIDNDAIDTWALSGIGFDNNV